MCSGGDEEDHLKKVKLCSHRPASVADHTEVSTRLALLMNKIR